VTGLQGTCRLGVNESGSVTWLPRWVRALRTAHPALSINVEVDVSESLSWRLARDEIDAAIVGANSAHPELLFVAKLGAGCSVTSERLLLTMAGWS
jgi:DNA-binding transcriptional LysR family regulator